MKPDLHYGSPAEHVANLLAIQEQRKMEDAVKVSRIGMKRSTEVDGAGTNWQTWGVRSWYRPWLRFKLRVARRWRSSVHWPL